MFCSDDCRSWPHDEKLNNHGCWGKHAHIPDNDYWGICFMSCEPFCFGAIILMWYTRNIFLLASDIFFINWTVRMSDNLPERVQILGHVYIICITVCIQNFLTFFLTRNEPLRFLMINVREMQKYSKFLFYKTFYCTVCIWCNNSIFL